MNSKTTSERPERAAMFHKALDVILEQADGLQGDLSAINLATRYDARVGIHVHASATVRHRLHATVTKD